MQLNIEKARNKIKAIGHNPDDHPYVVDCDASLAQSRHVLNLSPCLTRSRYKGHWLTHRKRRMTIEEMFRLQGMDHSTFTVATSSTSLGQQIGNAMSVNVLERLLHSALQYSGILPRGTLKHDRWESGEALRHLQSQRNSHFKNKAGPLVPHHDRQKHRVFITHQGQRRMFIIDSGASNHIVSIENLTPPEKESIRPIAEPFAVETANGAVTIESEVDIYVRELDVHITAHLLQDTPTLLSLGKLVKEHGFFYIWKPGQAPYLQKGDFKITCWPQHDVPYIISASAAAATPSDNATPDELYPLDSLPSDFFDDTDPGGLGEPMAGAEPPASQVESQPTQQQEAIAPPQAPPAVPPPPAPVKIDRVKANRKAKRRQLSSKTNKHNLFMHFPRCPNCEIC